MFSNLKLKIFSWPFKLLMVLIFLGLIGWGVYYYLFNQNPLNETTIASITEKGLKINIIDPNKEVIFSLSSLPQTNVPSSNLPVLAVEAVLAVNFILNNSQKSCAPTLPLNIQLKNNCEYVYTNIVAKDYVLNNLIKANLARGDKSEDLFFKIKNYIVTSWLKKHFSQTDFFTFFLNYSYYGDNVIGLSSAVSRFFGKTIEGNSSNTILTPREAAFLAKRIYDNNSYIYSDTSKSHLITIDNILSAMDELGYLSKTEVDNAKKSKLSIKQNSSTDIYKIYSNSMVSVALPYTDQYNDITVASTLNKRIQDGLALSLYSIGTSYNIPSIAVYGVNKGDIVTGVSFDIVNSSVAKYSNRYPLVKVKYLLRPLFYLGLYNNGVYIPSSLINPNVQDIINDQNLAPSSITKYFPIFAEGLGNNIDVSNANQQTVLNKIAMQLVNIENGLFNKLDNKELNSLFVNLKLPVDSLEKEDNKYSCISTFDNIVNSYAILNQEGSYYTPIFMTQVNEEILKSTTAVASSIDKQAIEKTLTVIKTEKVLDEKYKVIYDNNMAIIYYKNYTIGVWFGNNNVDPEKNLTISRFTALQKAAPIIVQTIITSLKEIEELQKSKANTEPAAQANEEQKSINNTPTSKSKQ